MDIKTAERLQQYRKKQGLSQEELADKLNVSRQAVSKWERGEASPDTDNLIALAKLYNITIDELINENLQEQPQKDATAKEYAPPEITEAEVKPQVESTTEVEKCSKEDAQLSPQKKKIISIVNGSASLVLTLIYFIIGFCTNIWHPTWIIFMFLPVILSLNDAILKKNATHFAYPVLAAAIYLIFSFTTKMWHPAWVIFLTIPIYYLIAEAITDNKKDSK